MLSNLLNLNEELFAELKKEYRKQDNDDDLGTLMTLGQEQGLIIERMRQLVIEIEASCELDNPGRLLKSSLKAFHRTNNLNIWTEADENGILSLCCSPKSIGAVLHDMVWDKDCSHVLTSGTMSDGTDFSFFMKENGIDRLPKRLVVTSSTQSPFDYRNHTRLYIPDTVYGYATNETEEMLPLPLVLAHNICREIDIQKRKYRLRGVMPDGKAQVTVEYEDGKAKRIKTIVVSVQHSKKKPFEELENEIRNEVLPIALSVFPADEDTEILINPAGCFNIGGPEGDTGLTGRKIMVDTYGGLVAHGGGAFSGKDATKVDRSGAYMARYIAKNIVKAGLAERCQVGISYAIGKAEPIAVSVDSFGTSSITDEELAEIVTKVFDLRPAAIIDRLDLSMPIYKKTSAYGHFNSPDFPWEKTDAVPELMKVAI